MNRIFKNCLDEREASAGRAMAQAVTRRPRTAEVRVRSQVSPCEVGGGQCGNRTSFATSTSVFSPVYIMPPMFLPNRPKSNTLSKIAENWAEKYFHFFRLEWCGTQHNRRSWLTEFVMTCSDVVHLAEVTWFHISPWIRLERLCAWRGLEWTCCVKHWPCCVVRTAIYCFGFWHSVQSISYRLSGVQNRWRDHASNSVCTGDW